MKVLYLSPSMTQGGAERQLSDLMRLLNGRVTQHLALIYPVSTEPLFFREEGIPVSFFDKRPGRLGRPALAWRYARLLAAFRPDIVHAYLWHAMDAARAFHRIFSLGRPLLLVNPQALTLTEERRQAERRFGKMTDHVIANSPLMAEDYQAAVPGSDISIIRNGVDGARFMPGERTAARALINVPRNVSLLLFVGRFSEEKNLDSLLRAVSILRSANRWPEDARLLAVGRTVQPEYTAQLGAIIQQENLGDVVTMRSETPDILPYYRACDALLLPSHYESLGNVVLEAAACERPALVSEAVNRNHLVKDGETGWVAPGDDLAPALERILKAPRPDRDRMGAAAREYLLPEYDAESLAERYLSLYNHLIESRKR